MKRKCMILKYCLAAIFLVLNFTVSASLYPFTAIYSGSQEVPPNGSPATGTITGVYNDVTNTIYYRIAFSGLLTNTVAGHFHSPGAAGVNAPVIHHHQGLPLGVTSANFVSSNVFTEVQEGQLKAGLVYSNIHTTAIPSGEIRAQILLGAPSSTIYTFNNSYSGTQEVPPNASPATGNIVGVYDASNNTTFYKITFSGLTTNTLFAHFHAPGAPGVNAPVIHHHVGFPGGVTSGTYNGSNVFTDAQEGFLFNNLVYSNIHTASLPGGEIRAQITLEATPGVVCPANILTANDAGLCTATESFAASTTGFPSPVVTYTINNVLITAPYAFPVGTTTVTATATNTAGTASCNFTVMVSDTEAPVVSGMSASPNELWPPNNKMQDVTVNYSTADNCPGTLSCELTVTSNEGSSSDWQIVDAHHVKLRAKRDGNGNGRTYTIAATCRDAAGNTSSSSSTTVSVPHDRGNRPANIGNSNSNNADTEGLAVNVTSNPTTTSFNVKISSPQRNGALQVRVYNLSGVLVESRNNLRPDKMLRIGGSLPPGVYLLQVKHGHMVSRTKLVKQ